MCTKKSDEPNYSYARKTGKKNRIRQAVFVADHLLFGSLLVFVSYTHCLYSTKIKIYVAILSNMGYSSTGQMVQLDRQFN